MSLVRRSGTVSGATRVPLVTSGASLPAVGRPELLELRLRELELEVDAELAELEGLGVRVRDGVVERRLRK